jgi:hypothetical protein
MSEVSQASEHREYRFGNETAIASSQLRVSLKEMS